MDGMGKPKRPMTAPVSARAKSSQPPPLRPEELQGLQSLLCKDLTIGTEIGKGRFKQVHQGTLRARKRPGSDQTDTCYDVDSALRQRQR